MSDSAHRPPEQVKRYDVALASYWMLFIIAPLALFLYWRGFSLRSLGEGAVLLVALCMVGERLFRAWRRRFVD